MIYQYKENDITIIKLENDQLEIDIAPELGGKILNIKHKKTNHQFLWHNEKLPLQKLPSGTEYDPNFYGGIDELLPNDIPEDINNVFSPDHGELWTLPLNYSIEENKIILSGILPKCGLTYEREIELLKNESGISLNYKITNPSTEKKIFLWKFHAAIAIEAGDKIISPSTTAVVADGNWSRWSQTQPFQWPNIQEQKANIIPPIDNSMDFLFLYDLKDGYMGWRRPTSKLALLYKFDKNIFPYNWYFASYGGFDGHYTAVLEPCTTMPLSVNEASKLNQCSVLNAGETIETTVYIYAGSDDILNNHI